MIEMMGEYTNVLEKHLGRLERLLKKNEVDKESVLEAGVSRSKSMDNLSSGRLATFTDTVRMTKDTVSNYGVRGFEPPTLVLDSTFFTVSNVHISLLLTALIYDCRCYRF